MEDCSFRFCPYCSSILTLDTSDENINYRFKCYMCPYYISITRKYVCRNFITKIKPKFEEEIVDVEKEKQRRQKTQVVCPECSHTEAFFHQMQTRSADEPMTNFYECANNQCKHNWRD